MINQQKKAIVDALISMKKQVLGLPEPLQKAVFNCTTEMRATCDRYNFIEGGRAISTAAMTLLSLENTLKMYDDLDVKTQERVCAAVEAVEKLTEEKPEVNINKPGVN